MIRWIPYTFVRTVTFFIGGILTGIYFPDVVRVPLATTLLILACLLYGVAFTMGHKRRGNLCGAVALTAVFLCGYTHLLFQKESRSEDHLVNIGVKAVAYQVVLTGFAHQKERSWKIEGEVTAVGTGARWARVRGKVILYFDKTIFTRPFGYGDVLVIKGLPKLIDGPGNPHEFDYRSYLAGRNIYHHHFIRDGDVHLLGHSPPNSIVHASVLARGWANGVLELYLDDARELAVAAALVLGLTDGLDDALLTAYSGSGAMHVLAVSGLHISIIYFILAALLKPINKTRRGEWCLAVFSLAVLWGYAFVTGLSPSVLRAVSMFTFVIIGKAIARHTNIYNTLAASAFCLLVFDPLLLTSVGFQLSYLAVFGIVYIHPLIYEQWIPRTWLANETWKITSVSIAAQLATFPLGLFYFHQFPNYFLLANLVVIPLSFAVLVLGLGLFAASAIPALAVWVGKALGLSIMCLNGAVLIVERLPMSVIENINISAAQTFLLLVLVIAVLMLLQRKNFLYVKISTGIILLIATLQWQHHFGATQPTRLVVYRIPGHIAIDIFDCAAVYFFGDSSLAADPGKIDYHIRPKRSAMMVNRVSDADHPFSREIPGGRFIAIKNTLLLQITNDIFEPRQLEAVDVIVIGNDSVKDYVRLRQAYRNAVIVFDSSNSLRYIETMLAEGPEAHSVLHRGAFEFVIPGNS